METDKTLRDVEAALRRAAKNAWALAVQTGTPFIVWQDGKVVDLNEQPPPKKSDSTSPDRSDLHSLAVANRPL
jgi:hypothetical protein